MFAEDRFSRVRFAGLLVAAVAIAACLAMLTACPSQALADETTAQGSPAALADEAVAQDNPAALTDDATAQDDSSIDRTLPQEWKRLSGKNAFDTMQKICNNTFSYRGCDVAILATAGTYHDALTAASLAGLYKCPVFITDENLSIGVSEQVENEIGRLGVEKVFICGGTYWIPADVTRSLNNLGVEQVERLAGNNAAATALKVYEAGKGSWGKTAIVATDQGYWDALAAGAYAYAKGAPIFLTSAKGAGASTKLDSATLQAIAKGGFDRVVLCGGTYFLDSAVEGQLKSAGFKGVVKRIAGANACETSVEMANFELGEGMRSTAVAVASADGYWDALTGTALCGYKNIPMVLVSTVNDGGARDLKTLDAFVSKIEAGMQGGYLLGGESSVTPAVYNALAPQFGQELVTGWSKFQDAYHYFDENGTMARGYLKLPEDARTPAQRIHTDDKQHYFDENTGAAVDGDYRKVNGTWRYFSIYGMATAGYMNGYVVGYDGTCYAVDTTDTGDHDGDARRVAKVIAQAVGPKGSRTDIERVNDAAYTVACFSALGRYTMEGDIYYTPYGVFIAREYSCAGSTRALGLVLDYMGFAWTHVNENQYTHQWNELVCDGKPARADGMAGGASYKRS